jgi:hypothetical protein
MTTQLELEQNMDMNQRRLLALRAAEAFREAWALMDQALGWDASGALAEHGLVTIIHELERQEFQGVVDEHLTATVKSL